LNEFNLITGRLLPVSESLIKPSGFTDFDPDDVPF